VRTFGEAARSTTGLRSAQVRGLDPLGAPESNVEPSFDEIAQRHHGAVAIPGSRP
jgi:hypothetical protein